jgi:hypothetical protein
MKEYTVVREFWRHGALQKVGAAISMLETEAKYLKHALAEKVAEVEKKVEVAVKRGRAPKANAAVVVEAPADGDHNVN